MTAVGPRRVARIEPPSRIQGAYVPAGTRFSARLEDGIDSARVIRGSTIRLRTDQALTGPHGRVVVPRGAVIDGRVVSNGPDDAPALRLAFESVQTVRGPAPLHVAVRTTENSTYRPDARGGKEPVESGSNGTGRSTDGSGFGWTANGTGPGAYNVGAYFPREVRLAPGARIDLVLTRDLLAPGTVVLPER